MINNELRSSLQETCMALNSQKVEYLIIGGVAVGFHGYQRISGVPFSGGPDILHDIDIWYNPTIQNYYAIVEALKALGNYDSSLEKLVFDPQKTYLRIPQKTFQIEFLPQLMGLTSFSDCYGRSEEIVLDKNKIRIIGLNDLILNKEAVGRDLDKVDVEQLKKANEKTE